ncbi:MAG: C25 family cysteine peptidase [Kiritimatiellia bacterium]
MSVCAAQQNTVKRVFNFEPPLIIEQPDNTCRIEMDNCRPDDIPSKPSLPVYSVSVDIPAGFRVDKVALTLSEEETIQLSYPVVHAQPFFKPGQKHIPVEPDPLIYQADTIYPQDNRLSWRTDPTGGKNLLSGIFSPVQYNPKENLLFYYSKAALVIYLAEKQTESVTALRMLNTVTSPLNPEDRFDYLIISTSNLIETAAPPWDFNALLDRRDDSGFITEIIPVEWIYENYDGVDRPEKIRHFLQDAHKTWNLRYLLIAGTHSMIPTRLLHIEIDGIFTDYIDDIPADHVYYGCMEGSYDGNGNGLYGEYNDGDGGGDVDLTAEILVGRFPVENATELSHMVRKTLEYDLASEDEFYNNGFMSEKIDIGNNIYAKPFMEEIRKGSTAYGRDTLGYTTSPYTQEFITTNNLHDGSNYNFTAAEALNYFTNKLHSINHFGHGSYHQCFKLNSLQETGKTAIASLDNPFPWFVYSQACLCGAFDKEDCFAEHFVTVSNAASVVIMNSRNGWANSTGVYGHSHYFHRHFWNSLFRSQASTFGEMNEASRRANLGNVPSFGASLWRWVYYELNLFGDPALPVMPSLLKTRPVFSHTPLQNTYNITSNHTATCSLGPTGIYDSESPFAVWSSSAHAGSFTQKMTRLTGSSYRLEIPAQPLYSRIDYFISASNRAGYAAAEPESDTHTFYITDKLDLLIAGSPYDIGTVNPAYGNCSSASGLVINASAVTPAYDSEDIRYVNNGFIGTGSIPPESTNQFISFQIDVNSILIWRWQKEYRTLINSSLAIPPEKTYWLKENSAFRPPPAELYVTDTMTNLFAFAGWQMDGTRSPAPPEKSVLQHPDIISDAPHELQAVYIPAAQDSDGNGIEDWWEHQYFGETGQDIFADHDDDGYDLYEEFEDHSDPLDPAVIPAAPYIEHEPLDSTADHPGPFSINATITDTHAVTNACVKWRINSSLQRSTPMTLISNSLYSADIAHETSPGDMIRYTVEADDPSGNHRSTDTFDVFLAYPVADYSMMDNLTVASKPQNTVITNKSFIINRGNVPLNWSIAFGFEEKFVSDSLKDLIKWDVKSIEQSWVISTNRSCSPAFSMHAFIVSTGGSPHYASISLPPLVIGTDAELSFYHWMDGEVSTTEDPTRAFDGGIIEYSLDAGNTYQQLAAPYTHTIYGWNMSPWPDNTPCFSGHGNNWEKIEINLNQYHPEFTGFEGQTVIFRFTYGSDDNTDREGWYIDDIRISPTSPPAGFDYSLPAPTPLITYPGSYSELLFRNLPHIMNSRTEYTSVFLDSNAPENAAFSFLWQALIRENPLIYEFNINQQPFGDGDVNLLISTREKDNEPIDLQLEWSDDRGHNWHSAALKNIAFSPAFTNIPDSAPEGVISGIPGTTNSVPVTNTVNAVWNSAAPETDIGWLSNVCMRLNVSNRWFTTNSICIFPVDNIPPAFTPGTIAAGPQNDGGNYIVSSNLVTFAWPPAIDTPENNQTGYRLTAGTDVLGVCTNRISMSVIMSNRLNQQTSVTVTPFDPLGNQGEALELAVLVLDPDSDYDNDGTSTGDETKAGTDASDSQSVFIINSCNSSTDSFTLSWHSVTNRFYTVQTCKSLSDPVWTDIPELKTTPGTGEIMTADVPQAATNAFFRVKAEQ